ncbi:hypothetical protein [Arcobacter porcinus]|uniref:Uncharacterized protein n=1 Tax=Arcobacter porcinus TaxID=1935204 RepID=A0ABX2YE72_9BACT|nr:hypothetical protein [Arcobacter porcinus]OCL89503.1 hypothetical protein AAX28_02041 [Arcobacter porcinus]
MPQLIAMIIIVVGAMIYMFQTFGGTGDKITGVAQKTSIITEINNIKSGLQFAARDKKIATTYDAVNGNYYNSLAGFAKDGYFADQINEQIANKVDGTARDNDFNHYSAISFGGDNTNVANYKGDMMISLVLNEGRTPGIFVDLSKGGLKDNAPFLEAQIANDLKSIAYINRKDTANDTGTITASNKDRTTGTSAEKSRIPDDAGTGADNDGMFTIYFKDFGSNDIVRKY